MAYNNPKKRIKKQKQMPKKAAKADGHDDIDHKIRVNEMKQELAALAGREPHMHTSPDCPPEVEEQFLANMLKWERGPFMPQVDRLKRAGFDFVEASKLSDKQVTAKLKDLIELMAKWRIFTSHTNHLSDRELYEWLRTDGLMEEVPDLPPDPHGAWHIDVLGSYGEEEVKLFNKYYATPKERKKHQKDFPDWALPPHEDPKYDRDRHLPTEGF